MLNTHWLTVEVSISYGHYLNREPVSRQGYYNSPASGLKATLKQQITTHLCSSVGHVCQLATEVSQISTSPPMWTPEIPRWSRCKKGQTPECVESRFALISVSRNMYQILCCDWITRLDKMALSRALGINFYRPEENLFFIPYHDKSFIDEACSVKRPFYGTWLYFGL